MANGIAPGFLRRPSSHGLKEASVKMIDREIARVYERARESGEKPPNLVELLTPVRAALAVLGYCATSRQIQKIARNEKHARQRLSVGKPA
jgi:hypothetical protein